MTSPRPRPQPRRTAPPVAAPPPVAPPPENAPPRVTPPQNSSAEYLESIVVPSQVALGVVVAVAAGAILLALGLWPLAIVAVLVVAGVVYYLGVQILTVDRARIAIGQGRGDNSPHLVQATDVVAADIVTLTWPQCFGLGLPDTVDTTRYTVRAGPVVSLTLRDGELLRISAADPAAVLAMIGR